MGRAALTLNSKAERMRAVDWINRAPTGTRVLFQASKRTTDQNAKLWVLLTEIADQVEWHGMKLQPADWKLIFLHGLNTELRIVPSIDGKGFVNLGTSSSKLSKQEMSMLIELILMFGAERGVKFGDDHGHSTNRGEASDTCDASGRALTRSKEGEGDDVEGVRPCHRDDATDDPEAGDGPDDNEPGVAGGDGTGARG